MMFGRSDDDQASTDNQVAPVDEPKADASLVAGNDDTSGSAPSAPADNAAPDEGKVVEPDQKPAEANQDDQAPAASVPDSDDLAVLKQQALQQLSPLVSHLDQTPEEKFRTIMMMIQASDDQSLVKSAFEAAQDITDEKARAQALLDVVNEINYFTQNGNNQPTG